jgi:hypothetical protein
MVQMGKLSMMILIQTTIEIMKKLRVITMIILLIRIISMGVTNIKRGRMAYH